MGDYLHGLSLSSLKITLFWSRDNGIEISGAYVPTIYPVPGDHRGESSEKW